MPFTKEHVQHAVAHLVHAAERRLQAREARRSELHARLPQVARMLREEFGARRVALMGSLDAPWFTEQSDVDLVVEGIEPGAAAAAEERALKLLGAPVDLLLWEELAPSFRRAVETEGRLIA